ncbi:hypothetical protein GCM10011487_19240 [Steroidobacter agaridevorans]|uniref:DUF885 domain-containing protein n=1 Tax=Steroidobacter agaridevorans TaxID=2695856 RepID=A0A829Y9A4_9GAMM|nr:DUF885 family protein [Steroidobacter agaridevorans]GFE79924.1 hypothetical protein GCM10011487_19240 [Steroidobacter agaridevorans]
MRGMVAMAGALWFLGAPGVLAQSGPSDAVPKLNAIYQAEWEWWKNEMAEEPDDERPGEESDHLARVDEASQQARLAHLQAVLADVNRIGTASLTGEDKVNAEIFRTILEERISDLRFKTYQTPFNADSFFWTEFTPREGFPDQEAYRRYLGRLADVPRYFDEHIANMRAGLKRGFTVPKVSVMGRDKTIEPYLATDDTNPLFLPFTQMPANIAAGDQERIRSEARDVIAKQIAPAYTKLLEFIRKEYLAKARTSISASTLPDGAKFYQARIEKFTTLELTAEQIHQIGLGEVARIKEEMQTTMQKAGFKGTLPEFYQFLRTDPQFYAKTPHQLIAEAAYIVKKSDLKLKDTIGTLPRFRHGILPVPDALAPIYTGGRGGLESCLFNTYNLPARPLYTLPSLVLHECTPGHSFQAALALEAPERPKFRNDVYFSGYGEGWGLYTEWLGRVMGIYETPYEEFGQLTYEMWRAARLVVDTGIHHYGWSRDQALQYMKDNVALSTHEITTEVDRYIAWPGQAVAYKLGELQIRRHRRDAEQALGPKFDQRKFHDAILALGAVPLPVLEQRMAQFIADGGENPSTPSRDPADHSN